MVVRLRSEKNPLSICAPKQRTEMQKKKMEQQKKAQKEKANERLVEDFGRQGAKRVMKKTAARRKFRRSVEDSREALVEKQAMNGRRLYRENVNTPSGNEARRNQKRVREQLARRRSKKTS